MAGLLVFVIFIIACIIFVLFPRGGKIMLSPQLRKIKIQLEEGKTSIDFNKEELLAELKEIEAIEGVWLGKLIIINRSLSYMRKEVVNMDYRELRKLKMELLQKNNKLDSEIQLLAELQSLSGIIDRIQHSLSLSTKICKSCGRPL